jgi:hypothetical protein
VVRVRGQRKEIERGEDGAGRVDLGKSHWSEISDWWRSLVMDAHMEVNKER